MGIHQAFFRSRGPVVYLQYASVASVQSGVTAVAGFALNTSQAAQERVQAVYSTLWTWLTDGVVGDYEARWTNVSGTLSAGTAGSWLALSSTQEWSVSRAGLGVKACQGTLEIRRVSDGVVLATATIDLSAEVS